MTTTYLNVQDWLQSDPAPEMVTKVLDLINRGAKKSIRLDILQKTRTINKMQKTMTEMEKYGIDVPKDFQRKITDLEFEIESMKLDLEGVTKPKKEKKKKEVIVE